MQYCIPDSHLFHLSKLIDMTYPIMVYVLIIASDKVQDAFFNAVQNGVRGHGKVIENLEGKKGFNLRLPYGSNETADGTTYMTYFADKNPPEMIRMNPIIQKAFVIIRDGTLSDMGEWMEYIERVKQAPGKAFGEPYVLCFTLVEEESNCRKMGGIDEDTVEQMFLDLHNLVRS